MGASTMEANTAMLSILRRDNGATNNDFLSRLAKESGIETPTPLDLAKLGRKRARKVSNKE